MVSKKEFHLKKLIKELKSKRGRHTELITVYVPAGFNLDLTIGQLSQEAGTATNIKSTSTRKNVTGALEKTIQHLRLFKGTPKNGLAIFCGNTSEREGVSDFQLWSIEPPDPISIKIYRCDQVFVTEPLEDLIADKDIYGLIAIDNKTATLATLKGDRYTIIKTLTSGYSGKHRAGGQSQRRFERLIEEQSFNFKKRVAGVAEDTFLQVIKDLRGLVIGGPAGTKDDFVEGNFLHHELKKKIISVEDITYTDESGIRELIAKSKDVLTEVEIVRQKDLMQQFLKHLVGDGSVAYGPDIKDAVTAGAVDTLMLSEKLAEKEIDELYEAAEETGAKIEILSDEFEEGFQLINTFGGKAALLRFKIN
ncbi:MAG: peptide chain release factor aRF-1 [Candidatus Altiarchaeota archaeon]